MQNSPKSPCWQQKQIAAQTSYLASIADKKEVVYKAPCDVAKEATAKIASAEK